ncbi:MAG TPA: hypothetical protein VKA76_11620 [Gammaproteobacteria bacterium]|nr:hypothetical protein [Gammaproteobacteria bacterium]
MCTVELIYDPDCPNIAAARRALMEAFGMAGQAAHWREWRRNDTQAPDYVRRFGSPTVLVDGLDVEPTAAAEGHGCCRLYPAAAGGLRRAPAAALIAARLRGRDRP